MTIHCAFLAILTGAPITRIAQSGREWVSLNLKVGNGDSRQWVQCSVFGDAVPIAAALRVEQVIYVEGVLELQRWENHDGQPRSGLKVTVSQIRPAELRRQPRKHETPVSQSANVPNDMSLDDAIDF